MNRKLLLQDLIDRLSSEENLKKKDAEDFLRVFFRLLTETILKEGSVKINGLGTFKLIKVDDRSSVDVNTGKSFVIKGHYKLGFSPDEDFRKKVNKPFEAFIPVETEDNMATDYKTVAEDDSGKPEAQSYDSDNEDSQKLNEDIKPEKPENEIEDIHVNEAPVKNVQKDSEPVKEKESSDKEIPDKMEKSPHVKNRNKITNPRNIFWFLLLLVVAGIALWSIKSNHDAKREYQKKFGLYQKFKGNEDSTSAVADTSEQAGNRLDEDSVVSEIEKDMRADSLERTKNYQRIAKQHEHEQKTAEKSKLSDRIAKAETNKKTVKSQSEKFPKYETLKSGSRLTLLAEKYYGNKIFWVYIYLDNKDKIKNPDCIPAGTSIRISKPDSSKINAKNPSCIEKATELQRVILGKTKS